MKIATWNVNSIKARLPNVLDWLRSASPDVLLLQEIKCQTADFPALEFTALGYQAEAFGQKSYNGVAILAKQPIENVVRSLPETPEDDTHARYIEASIGDVRVASIYLPNGNPAPGEKFVYKLAWMDRLIVHARNLLRSEAAVVLAGDYNICPTDEDVYDPTGWAGDALCRPEGRGKFRTLINLGYTEAFRTLHPDEPHRYSFWDYQAGAWQRDNGLRIDHFLLSPQAADRLVACDIDKEPRGREKASDHVPVWCQLS